MGENGGRPKSVNAIQAAAKLGSRLQEGPLSYKEAVLIVADRCKSDFDKLHPIHKQYYRSRTTMLINSISTVGGLPVAEGEENGRIVYFLI